MHDTVHISLVQKMPLKYFVFQAVVVIHFILIQKF